MAVAWENEMNGADVYQVWRAMLAGKGQEVESLPFLADGCGEDPQPGLYKMRRHRTEPFVPVSIFAIDDDGAVTHTWHPGLGLKATVDGQTDDPMKIWTWCMSNPVSKTDVAYWNEHGRWPGEIATIGDNSGHLSLTEKISDTLEQAQSWLAKHAEITDQVKADECANWRAKLLDFRKQSEKTHKDEKAQHLEAGRAVDAKWKPVIARLDDTAKEFRLRGTEFLKAEEDKQRAAEEAERKRLAEEAKKKLLADEEARKAAEDKGEPAPEPQYVAPPVVETKKVMAGGQRGKRMSLRTETVVTVTDHAKALAFFANHKAVVELVEKLAKQAAKSGQDVPGVEVKQERNAA